MKCSLVNVNTSPDNYIFFTFTKEIVKGKLCLCSEQQQKQIDFQNISRQ